MRYRGDHYHIHAKRVYKCNDHYWIRARKWSGFGRTNRTSSVAPAFLRAGHNILYTGIKNNCLIEKWSRDGSAKKQTNKSIVGMISTYV